MVYDVTKDWQDPYEIADPDGRLAEEFRARPIGFHSAELQRVLLKMRIDPRSPAYILFCSKPHAEWQIARMGPMLGDPVEIEDEPVFTSIEAAEWEVFRRRWKALTGKYLT